jgi:hypothetical protein
VRRGILLAPVVFVLACPEHPKLELEDLQAEVSKALCQRAAACRQFPDVETCEATLLLDYRQLVLDKEERRVAYDEDLAFDCVEAIRRAHGPGSCSLTKLLAGPEVDACARAVRGKVPYNNPCFASDECQPGLVCDLGGCRDGECCAGTCRDVLKTGGNCSAAGSVCEAGAFCSKDPGGGPTLMCTARAKEGQECVGSAGCESGTLCFTQPGGLRPTCGRLPAHGERCTTKEDGPHCDAFSDYCDARGICSTRVALGEVCGPDRQCVWYGRCDPLSQLCVEKGHVTSACAKDDDCLGSLRCAGGKCAAPVFPEPCSSPPAQ